MSFEITNKSYLEFKLSNNFNPNISQNQNNGIGIANAKRRLKLLFYNDFILETTINDDKYNLFCKNTSRMKIKCVIIDDEPLAISVIENHLKNFDHVEIVNTFSNPLKAFGVLEQENIDVIFLDINMPQMTGFTFVENLSYKPLIVITTAYREYAVKSFELDVLDYLVKPIPFNRFLKTINKIYQKVYVNSTTGDSSLHQEPHIFIKVNKKLIKVNLNDILYIESLKDYIKILTTLGDYVVHKSLTAITEELPESNFIRVHRSYTISINKIGALDGNTIEIGRRKIPIGRNYLKQAKDRIFNTREEDNR